MIFLSDLTRETELCYAQVMVVLRPSELFLVKLVIFSLVQNGWAQLVIALRD